MARTDNSFSITGEDGVRRRYRVLSDLTVDDLMVLGAKAYVGEVAFGREYSSPFSRATRDYLVRTHVTTRG